MAADIDVFLADLGRHIWQEASVISIHCLTASSMESTGTDCSFRHSTTESWTVHYITTWTASSLGTEPVTEFKSGITRRSIYGW